jgi:hypothetical protein
MAGGNPEYQNVTPGAVPSPVTPADGPGDPAGYASVTPHGRGTAPYDIQDGLAQVQADVQSAFNGAAVSAAGINVYPEMGARQRATATLLNSPQGFNSSSGTAGYDITPGWSGEPGGSWPNNVQVANILETPIQGQMTYPAGSTYQDGVPKYGTD